MTFSQEKSSFGEQAKSFKGTNANNVPQNLDWKDTKKSPSVTSMLVGNRGSPRRYKHYHAKKWRTSSVLSILQGVGVVFVLLLMQQCLRRYVRCVHSLSRSTAEVLPKASAQGVPRRLAVYTGSLSEITVAGDDVPDNKRYQAVCRQFVQNSVSDVLPQPTANLDPEVGGLTEPGGSSRLECAGNFLRHAKIALGIIAALIWLGGVLSMILDASNLYASVPAGNSTWATPYIVCWPLRRPRPPPCSPWAAEAPAACFLSLGLSWFLYQIVSVILTRVEMKLEQRQGTAMLREESSVPDWGYSGDVAAFLAPKGPSTRRRAAHLPGNEEDTFAGQYY